MIKSAKIDRELGRFELSLYFHTRKREFQLLETGVSGELMFWFKVIELPSPFKSSVYENEISNLPVEGITKMTLVQ